MTPVDSQGNKRRGRQKHKDRIASFPCVTRPLPRLTDQYIHRQKIGQSTGYTDKNEIQRAVGQRQIGMPCLVRQPFNTSIIQAMSLTGKHSDQNHVIYHCDRLKEKQRNLSVTIAVDEPCIGECNKAGAEILHFQRSDGNFLCRRRQFQQIRHILDQPSANKKEHQLLLFGTVSVEQKAHCRKRYQYRHNLKYHKHTMHNLPPAAFHLTCISLQMR